MRWEQTEKIHVTMKFIGEIGTAALDAIAAQLREGMLELLHSQESEESLSMFPRDGVPGVIDRTGGFPSLRRPRVVWLGFSKPPDAVLAIQRMVEIACGKAGVERENKAFTPHFTIGRVRQGAETGGLENALQACSFQSSPVRFTRLCIMESKLTPQGAIHKERTHISLTPGE